MEDTHKSYSEQSKIDSENDSNCDIDSDNSIYDDSNRNNAESNDDQDHY